MRILLTGSNGQVGWELRRTLSTLGTVVAPSSQELNLADPDAIRRVVRQTSPQLIVNPAAYTAVDKAESETVQALAINGAAPGILAEEAKRLNAALIHYSTDYVFDGSLTRPYGESDPPNPLNSYGRSKLAGEQAIAASGCAHLIFRTSWVYGTRGRNFLLIMQKLLAERDVLNVVADQIGAPTWSRTIAEASAQILAQLRMDTDRIADLSGIYNLTCAGQTSWHGFALAIAAHRGSHCQVNAITTSDYPTPAARPLNSVLAHDKLMLTFGLHMPDWEHALDLCLQD